MLLDKETTGIMHNIQSYFYTILLSVTLILFPAMVQAEDGVVPSDKLEGLWAASDCSDWDNLQYYTKHFIITHNPDKNSFTIEPVSTLLTQKEYKVISINEKETPVRILEDGVLQQVDIEDNADFSKPWDELPIIRHHEYMHCLDADLPDVFTKLIELSPYLDNLYPYCQYSISAECVEQTFKSYLSDNENNIQINKIEKILKDMALVSHAIGESMPTKQDIEKDINEIAEIIFSIIDEDDSKEISLEELKNTKIIWGHPKLTAKIEEELNDIIKNITVHFPSLENREKEKTQDN